MASILIKDIPADLHDRLRQAAQRDRRSLNKEVIALLDEALKPPSAELPPLIRGTFPLTPDWLEQAISEGRK
jgi:plasmid stability protein